jgi:hypothetical protein
VLVVIENLSAFVPSLNGTVAIIDAVTSINISAIVFKQGNTVAHIINSNLPKINVNDSTWTLENNDTWTSKLTQGEYTVTVSLSDNDNSITHSSSTIMVDIVKPVQPEFSFVDTGRLDNDGITRNGMITISNLEADVTWEYSTDSGTSFTNGINSSFMLNEGTYGTNAIQIRQTDVAGNVSDIGKNTLRIFVDNTDPTFDSQPTIVDAYVNDPITTTVYDAQVTNLHDGIADEDITYSIEGTNADCNCAT